MLQRSLATLLCAATLLACSSDTTEAPTPQQEAVKAGFAQFQAALTPRNGQAASEAVTSQTLQRYQEYRNFALNARRSKLEDLEMIERAQVILIRALVPLDDLKRMDGQALFVHSFNEEWLLEPGLSNVELEDVQIDGDRATAHRVGNELAVFEFEFEDGAWKLDFLKMLEISNQQMESIAERRNLTQDQFILELINRVSGPEIGLDIWEPPLPKKRK